MFNITGPTLPSGSFATSASAATVLPRGDGHVDLVQLDLGASRWLRLLRVDRDRGARLRRLLREGRSHPEAPRELAGHEESRRESTDTDIDFGSHVDDLLK
jgi:hypothetical protein